MMTVKQWMIDQVGQGAQPRVMNTSRVQIPGEKHLCLSDPESHHTSSWLGQASGVPESVGGKRQAWCLEEGARKMGLVPPPQAGLHSAWRGGLLLSTEGVCGPKRPPANAISPCVFQSRVMAGDTLYPIIGFLKVQAHGALVSEL